MNFYAVIPTEILTSDKISSHEKILYGVISSLTNKTGYCFASNAALAEFFKKDDNVPHVKTISKWVNNLVDVGFLTNEITSSENNKKAQRRLRLTDKVIIRETIAQTKKEPKKENTGKYKGREKEIKQIISYLNKVTKKSFRYDTDSYIDVICGRFNEGGRTVDDFIKVIEVKSLDTWYINNPQYFAPTTLFSKSKFDKNLNSWTPEVRTIIYESFNYSEDEVVELDLAEEEY